MTARFWRFIHMLAHVPLGFGEPEWVSSFHDWTAGKWEATNRKKNDVQDEDEVRQVPDHR